MGSVKVAIVGVGNCAASLVQGVEYYKDADETTSVPGLMHVRFGEYHVSDVEFVAAFDVDAKKVGQDLSAAIVASENNTIKICDVPPLGVSVQRGHTFDGLGKYYREMIEESDEQPVDVVAALRESGADVVVCYLPVGSQAAAEFYAQAALDAGVLDAFNATLRLAEGLGASIQTCHLPHAPHGLSAYYVLAPAEASSNLARYDGVRYGLRVVPEDGPVTIERVMAATRAAGFGHEVKRRIILGTYALSAGNYDAYYGAALRVRTLIQRDYAAAFEKCDVLISPTAPSTAFKLGEKTEGDPMAMYLGDVATVPVNLAGVPALSLPGGLSEENNLPVGIQFTAPAREDARLYRVGAALEELLTAKWGAPLYKSLPDTETLIRDFDFGGTK